jgi:hypothetical protein
VELKIMLEETLPALPNFDCRNDKLGLIPPRLEAHLALAADLREPQ